MDKNTLLLAVAGAICVPALLWAIPQQIGGINNIMEEGKWDDFPQYEEWKMEGDGGEGRAGGGAPKEFVNLKPVEVLGLAAPVGNARLKADGRRWLSVEVRVPARGSDDFHLLYSTAKAESGREIAVAGKEPERFFATEVGRLRMEVREVPTGGLEVSLSRAVVAAASVSK